MSDSNLFGPIVDADDVEKGVAAALEVWIDTYLYELERIKGYDPGSLQRPLGYLTASQFAKWDEDQLPVILVLCAQTERVRKHEDGRYEASWLIGVQPIVSDVEYETSRALGMVFAAACRAAIVQHKLLKSALHPQGFSSATEWLGEDYTDLAFNSQRTLGTARTIFSVTVEDVVRKLAGPRTVPTNPAVDPGEWPSLAPPVKILVESGGH